MGGCSTKRLCRCRLKGVRNHYPTSLGLVTVARSLYVKCPLQALSTQRNNTVKCTHWTLVLARLTLSFSALKGYSEGVRAPCQNNNRGIFFVAVPSSFWGAKKEREKKGESSWNPVHSYLFRSASTQL